MEELRRSAEPVRLDKWLWAARFFKTRALAVEAIEKHRVEVNGLPAKPSRDVKPGCLVQIREPGQPTREVQVLEVSLVRQSASIAQQLYAETPASCLAREQAREMRKQGIEPAQSLEHGRPTKKDRRQITDWNRWSASADD
jgi:ribosome-associated heat shock protein Hsp15